MCFEERELWGLEVMYVEEALNKWVADIKTLGPIPKTDDSLKTNWILWKA